VFSLLVGFDSYNLGVEDIKCSFDVLIFSGFADLFAKRVGIFAVLRFDDATYRVVGAHKFAQDHFDGVASSHLFEPFLQEVGLDFEHDGVIFDIDRADAAVEQGVERFVACPYALDEIGPNLLDVFERGDGGVGRSDTLR